jgi:pre-rRNA-processing protein TSR1
MALDPEPLSTPTAAADDLTAENTPDLMANEQTWPTEEEMAAGQAESSRAGAGDRRVKRVPKGTSAYQAAWILDDETDAEDGDEDDEMDEDGDVEAQDNVVDEGEEDEEETEEVELDERRDEEHEDMDQEEEEKQ